MKRFDERDTIFARMNYKKGTFEYKDYYKRNPDKEKIDEELRELPEMGQEGSVTYNEINSPMVDAAFKYLHDIKDLSEGMPEKEKVEVNPEIMSEKLKGLAEFYNAKLVGITEMQEYHYYSHRGRHKENYGDEINNIHKYGIVFAVELDKKMIQSAPWLPESIGVVKGYVEAANIGMMLSYYIRELGYEARNHMDGNYLVVAPLVARDAGLGELGRNGLLITKELGPRIRLGVVTTNMPLITDSQESIGIKEFCIECGRCAKTCPGKSISKTNPLDYHGTEGWKINAEECYKRWRSLGTDCGLCLCNCPFSYEIPAELIQKIKDSSEVRKEILDDFQEKYGVRPVNREVPNWLK